MTDTIRLDRLSVTGASRGGVETWFRISPPGVAFDVGHGAPELSGVDTVFLSHGHLDHAAGVPFLLSQRALQDLGPTTIYCPAGIAEALVTFIAAAQHLESGRYEFDVRGLEAGDEVDLGRGLVVEAFATSHVAASLGFHLIEVVNRLRDEFRALPPSELVRLRGDGETIERSERRIWLSYTGDTAAEVLDTEERLFEAQVLLLECTFLDPAKRADAARYGHCHFADIVERADRFANETIVLHHLSRRFSAAALRREVERQLPGLDGRIIILGEERETT